MKNFKLTTEFKKGILKGFYKQEDTYYSPAYLTCKLAFEMRKLIKDKKARNKLDLSVRCFEELDFVTLELMDLESTLDRCIESLTSYQVDLVILKLEKQNLL